MNNNSGKTAIPGAGPGAHGQLRESSHPGAAEKPEFPCSLPFLSFSAAGNAALSKATFPGSWHSGSERGWVGAQAGAAPELSPPLHSCR